MFENIPAEKREKILLVALNEFSSRGYENANINVIAKKSGVSVGAMYKYFGSKQNLFLATVHKGTQALETVLSSISSSKEDVMVKLETLIRTAVEYSRVYNQLKAQGTPIPINDIWIAAEVFETGGQLYSCDGHFAKIPMLDWIDGRRA